MGKRHNKVIYRTWNDVQLHYRSENIKTVRYYLYPQTGRNKTIQQHRKVSTRMRCEAGECLCAFQGGRRQPSVISIRWQCRWMHQAALPTDIPRYVLRYRVFIPAQFVILKMWKQLKCTILEKLCHVYRSQWMSESYTDQHAQCWLANTMLIEKGMFHILIVWYNLCKFWTT